MRKPVKTEPTPTPENHGRDQTQANIEQPEGVSRRSDAKGESGSVSTTNSSKAALASTAVSIGLDKETSLNDAWLVERARHGDHAAFAVLVRRYERKLTRVLTRLVRDPELARDLAQETFWRSLYPTGTLRHCEAVRSLALSSGCQSRAGLAPAEPHRALATHIDRPASR